MTVITIKVSILKNDILVDAKSFETQNGSVVSYVSTIFSECIK